MMINTNKLDIAVRFYQFFTYLYFKTGNYEYWIKGIKALDEAINLRKEGY
ncbi:MULTISPECIES: hypothetical protein [Pasteurellaceae]|uniref:Uncharacterized protein n=1 Tax=Pasteurella atlantica TaxID=2827233 RepID=A0AAW8CR53_9PAST|nr:hypothetical protein [Pasteurella atlantica]MBR0573378.1 hypothetical protein [Pasteurella atlantica]MDP8039814.1 hypothetical protein [Pasteurella atlantica]MDP8041831.1 hypothetical protein [Pasteurella atlantica]MDP8043898.1 hypothetical protein [Pasteurella atlantica]MDP8046099.1 hypothetical protein [Pasteurella atlantica]